MKITNLAIQANNPDRVNISVDGKYAFSLDIAQVGDLKIKKDQEIDPEQLDLFLQESEFGKLYTRTLEYCLIRPRSAREVKDYLYKRSLTQKYKGRKGEIRERQGVSRSVTERVFDRLSAKGYVDDYKFAEFWLESRWLSRGASLRKLRSELVIKGISSTIIDDVLSRSERNDDDELAKVIAKKRSRYQDQSKFIVYLQRQGFSYGDIKQALSENS